HLAAPDFQLGSVLAALHLKRRAFGAAQLRCLAGQNGKLHAYGFSPDRVAVLGHEDGDCASTVAWEEVAGGELGAETLADALNRLVDGGRRFARLRLSGPGCREQPERGEGSCKYSAHIWFLSHLR